jgi:iron-regulated transporter 1
LVLTVSGQFTCNTEACSQLGEACDCLSQICCDASLNCTGGVCVGTPSVAGNDRIQLDFPNTNLSLSYTGIFQEASRYTTREVYDAYTYPLGPQEPTPSRIFQVNVEVGNPAPCCTQCSVGVSSFTSGTNSDCYSSGSCTCDPNFYQYANCSLNSVQQTSSCPAFATPPDSFSAQLLPMAALCLSLVLCVLLTCWREESFLLAEKKTKRFFSIMAGRLLLSHSLSCFSDRLWDFAFPVLLARFHPEHALFVAALYSLSGQCATFFLAALLGSALDASRSRLTFVSAALAVQNGATVLLSLAVLRLEAGPPLYACVALLSAASSLASMTERVMVTQEWAPALTRGQAEALRLAFNARLRQVYLVTKIGAPAAVGLAMGLLSPVAVLALVCGWNVVSCAAELALLRALWLGNSALRESPGKSEAAAATAPWGAAVGSFIRHPMLLCSLAYCGLFCTVLCPGSLLHVHLMTRHGVGESALAAFQGACSGLGVLGTLLVEYMGRRGMSVAAAALLFLAGQVAALWLACLGLWTNGWAHAFLALLALSRVGLWGFDVAHLQLMQEGLGGSSNRASISVIQYGLCDMCAVAIALPALLLRGSEDFHSMMQLSLGCVTASLGMFQLWMLRLQSSKKAN